MIEVTQPDIVLVELCQSRVRSSDTFLISYRLNVFSGEYSFAGRTDAHARSITNESGEIPNDHQGSEHSSSSSSSSFSLFTGSDRRHVSDLEWFHPRHHPRASAEHDSSSDQTARHGTRGRISNGLPSGQSSYVEWTGGRESDVSSRPRRFLVVMSFWVIVLWASP